MTEIEADCPICKRMTKVKKIRFYDIDESIDMELECGHPKAYHLAPLPMTSYYEHIRNMEEYDRQAKN